MTNMNGLFFSLRFIKQCQRDFRKGSRDVFRDDSLTRLSMKLVMLLIEKAAGLCASEVEIPHFVVQSYRQADASGKGVKG